MLDSVHHTRLGRTWLRNMVRWWFTGGQTEKYPSDPEQTKKTPPKKTKTAPKPTRATNITGGGLYPPQKEECEENYGEKDDERS